MPMNFRPMRTATRPVVPAPQNGSSTMQGIGLPALQMQAGIQSRVVSFLVPLNCILAPLGSPEKIAALCAFLGLLCYTS